MQGKLFFFRTAYLFLMALFLCAASVFAEDEAAEEGEEGEGVAAKQVIYLPLKPTFVINYGGAGRLRYLKTDVSVRVASIDAANSIRRHMPFVRNNLLMLFAAQTNKTVSSQEGKEKIRASALEEIRDIVEREERTPREDVIELFFNNFIVQK